MRQLSLCVLAAAATLVARPAAACIAREPLVEVLREASADVAACRAAHELPEGRYVVRLRIDPDGKLGEVALGEAPGALSEAAESCLAAAFARRSFAPWGTPEEPAASAVSGGGRASRVPPAPRRPGPGAIHVVWPFLLAS